MTTNAIYARVSDDKLKDDGERRQDVMRQVDRLREFAGMDAQLFVDDAKSAFKEDYNSRPEFLRMLREVRAKRVRHIWVESLDRWSRRIVEGITTLREVSEGGVTVTSVMEGEIDVTSAPGWFRTGIGLLFAEWASREKSDRVKQAMQRRRNDDRRICRSCDVVHMGRHPNKCECKMCIRNRRKIV